MSDPRDPGITSANPDGTASWRPSQPQPASGEAITPDAHELVRQLAAEPATPAEEET